MKKAFIVTSIIDVDNSYPLSYSNTRSAFTPDERLRQTLYTITSIDSIREDVTIYLLDASLHPESYINYFAHQRNLKFISISSMWPEIHSIVRSHGNKSYCESLILLKFFETFKNELSNFDIIFKVSGRYFFDNSFDTKIFDLESKSKLYFKKYLEYDWNDNWINLKRFDRRLIQKDNKLRIYSTVLYGVGVDYLDKLIDILRVITLVTNEDMNLSVETLLYYYTRDFEKDIVETSWIVNGWDGTTGTYLRY